MTYEEVKQIRQHPRMAHVDNNELHKMIDDAIEKQIAKKPIYHNNNCYFCSHCGNILFEIGDIIEPNFCPDCGQKIDWSDKE